MKWLFDQKTDFVEKNYIKAIFHCVSKKKLKQGEKEVEKEEKERAIDEENYI